MYRLHRGALGVGTEVSPQMLEAMDAYCRENARRDGAGALGKMSPQMLEMMMGGLQAAAGDFARYGAGE